MLKKTALILVALAVLTGYAVAGEETAKEKPAVKWYESLSDAQMAAIENGKLVLAYVFQSKG
ncbi:MAG: hypothetical protein ACYS8W_03990 [Planctomycetota bacterium]